MNLNTFSYAHNNYDLLFMMSFNSFSIGCTALFKNNKIGLEIFSSKICSREFKQNSKVEFFS